MLLKVTGFGTTQSIGVYNIEWLRYFDAGAAAVSLVGAINLGVFLGAGPLASVLMSRWSHRQVALLGAILSNLGLICMPFAPNLPFMYVFYGVISGLGNCLSYVPSHVLTGLYFSKHRSLATGIATAGSGLGSTIFPIIMYHLIQHYGWRGSLFIVTGLNLHQILFAALLHPVPKDIQASVSCADELMEMKEKREMSKNLETSQDIQEKLLNGKTCNDVKIVDGDFSNENGEIEVNEMENLSKATSAMLECRKNSDTKLTTRVKLVNHLKTVFTVDFVIFFISNICWNAGGAIVLIFYAEYAYTAGLDKEDSSTVFTMCGAGACLGCILGGFLGNVKYFNRIWIYIVGNIGVGLISMLIPWRVMHTFWGLFMLIFIFGLMFGIILGLLVVVTSDLLGTKALGDGFGYLMLANGLGVFGGPPLAGILIDLYGSQDPAMYLSGAFSTMGGLIMCLVPLRRWLFPITEKQYLPSITLEVVVE
ncbi:MOT14-like protein [Mya arenaria]|uniref:MOT14-like protein n=1 Tax=Mya arenaria TaxID=6604 RepID=A0ABY7FAY0_MYAAR|nr:MOT14-like protein [Mya arenaria]